MVKFAHQRQKLVLLLIVLVLCGGALMIVARWLKQLPLALDHSSGLNSQLSLKQALAPTVSAIKVIDYLATYDHLISDQQRQGVHHLAQTAEVINQQVLTGHKTWLILFQNSQELRATGGFMGSLAFITTDDGSVTKIDVQDVYQPDGQFSGYPNPPPGVRDYLSGGGNWRLPDMNWSPDFPISAALITKYVSLAHQPSVDGLIAVDLPVAQQLLKITGPIPLPDYQTSVTADNLAETLRQNRSHFFPGSIAKQQLLASFFTHFKLQLHQLSARQMVSLIPIFSSALQTHEIQIMSPQPELQSFLQQANVTGALPSQVKVDWYLFPVESNVGINKANQAISRTYQLDLKDTTSTFTINFTNQNSSAVQTSADTFNPRAESPHLDYVDYQRLLIKPSMTLQSLTLNGQPIAKLDTQALATSTGETLTQIGFFVVVPTQQSAQLIATFAQPALTQKSTVLIGKQSGISPVPLEVTGFNHHQSRNLSQTLLTSPQDW